MRERQQFLYRSQGLALQIARAQTSAVFVEPPGDIGFSLVCHFAQHFGCVFICRRSGEPATPLNTARHFLSKTSSRFMFAHHQFCPNLNMPHPFQMNPQDVASDHLRLSSLQETWPSRGIDAGIIDWETSAE